ncbi:MAG: hypothetical protein DCC55_23690 [Chloroflexi bacterium]|nr:MAG: hypothetical protein DCC55_23690 [Chloroflexota bacterium]
MLKKANMKFQHEAVKLSNNVQQAELRRLRLLVEAMQIRAKGEPTVSLAEVMRRIAAKQTTSSAAKERAKNSPSQAFN